MELIGDIKTFVRRNIANMKSYSLNDEGYIGSHWNKKEKTHLVFDCVAHVSGLNLLLCGYALLD